MGFRQRDKVLRGMHYFIALDAQINRDIASGPKQVSGEPVRESTTVGCVSVDSAWLSFSSSPKSRRAARNLAEPKSPWAHKLAQDRHVNIVGGRATLADRTLRVRAYRMRIQPVDATQSKSA